MQLVERGLPLPAYDQVLKCSHAFNLLDARGAISVTERAAYIGRVRNLARASPSSTWRPLPSLLLEIGCEELPAAACREAEAQLRERWLPELGEGSRLRRARGGSRSSSPRSREREPDRWVQGPPEHLREKAAAGFARKQGVAEDELEVRDGFLGVTVPGRPMSEALPERLAAIVAGLAFGKSMVWEKDGLRFSRPVRWLCAKLDKDTMPVRGGRARVRPPDVRPPLHERRGRGASRPTSTSRPCARPGSSRSRTSAAA